MSRDVLGEWFEAIASVGQDIMIRFGRVDSAAAEPVWFPTPHSQTDGVGGFALLLRKNGHPGLTGLPQLKEGLVPRLLQVLRAWAGHVFIPKSVHRWPPLPARTEPSIAWRVFDEAESARIVALARSLGVTVNTYLLDRISRVVRRQLVGQPAAIAWMIPINMRGPLRLESETTNQSSFLEISVRRDEPESQLQARVRGAVAAGQHWAYWYSFQFGRLLGRVGRRWFIRPQVYGPAHWVGSFSNLGLWDPPADGPTAYGWLFCPPPVPSQPIGVGCVTYRGRLSLTMMSHCCLGKDQAAVQGWVGGCASELLGTGTGAG